MRYEAKKSGKSNVAVKNAVKKVGSSRKRDRADAEASWKPMVGPRSHPQPSGNASMAALVGVKWNAIARPARAYGSRIYGGRGTHQSGNYAQLATTISSKTPKGLFDIL